MGRWKRRRKRWFRGQFERWFRGQFERWFRGQFERWFRGQFERRFSRQVLGKDCHRFSRAGDFKDDR